MHFLYGLIGLIIGILILKYSPGIYKFTGKDNDAEQYLGRGGTYKFIKIFGVVIVVFSLLYMLGYF